MYISCKCVQYLPFFSTYNINLHWNIKIIFFTINFIIVKLVDFEWWTQLTFMNPLLFFHHYCSFIRWLSWNPTMTFITKSNYTFITKSNYNSYIVKFAIAWAFPLLIFFIIYAGTFYKHFPARGQNVSYYLWWRCPKH